MKAEIPNPKSLNPKHPVHRLPIINHFLRGLKDREPSKPGNITMKQHTLNEHDRMNQMLKVELQWPQ